MIRTGLLSVTFRSLTAEEIIDIAVQAKLEGIEWGGDIHIPHGDEARAREIGRKTREAGLRVASYGSYYRPGVEQEFTFEEVLASAVALGAPSIRVWAGNMGSANADADLRQQVAAETYRIASVAEREGIVISYEYHSRTLTDTAESTVLLLQETDHPNLRTLWQPPVGLTAAQRMEGLKAVSPWLENVHAFYWLGEERRPFAEGEQEWKEYLRCLHGISQEKDRYVMLEFVKDNDPKQLLEDAAVLRRLVEASKVTKS